MKNVESALKGLCVKISVPDNLSAVRHFLEKKGLEALYVPSFDPYLSEYVPLTENPRYFVTGMTGSTAEALVLKNKAFIFVDGRYYEQAEIEVNTSSVTIVKVPAGVGLRQSLCETLTENHISLCGVDGSRTPYSFKKLLEEANIRCQEYDIFWSELFYSFSPLVGPQELEILPENLSGESSLEKLRKLKEGLRVENCLYFLSALDSIAWISNTRSFHIPEQSYFKAKAIAVLGENLEAIVCLPTSFSKKSSGNLQNISFLSPSDFSEQMGEKSLVREQLALLKEKGFEKIFFNPNAMSAGDYALVCEIFGEDCVISDEKKIFEKQQSVKNPKEIRVFEVSFERAAKAIHDSLKWLKEETCEKENWAITEQNFAQKVKEFYEIQGMKQFSFKTIAGMGTNSSIIHYSPGTTKAEKNQLALLDSGAFFEGALATDCTRTILMGKQAYGWQKEIYTLVLKGLLAAQNAIFPEGTVGSFVDSLARSPLFQMGYNYNHGTGHGVGINVHEAGYSLSPFSQVILRAGVVGSIEPGIYLPGKGGVRLENVAIVERHSTYKNFLCFRPLMYVGFDHDLIDFALLSPQEKKWLEEYEAECLRRGTN